MTGTARYTWVDHWATIPESGRANGRTHGVCATRDGRGIVFHHAENGLLTFDPDGALITYVVEWIVGGRITMLQRV